MDRIEFERLFSELTKAAGQTFTVQTKEEFEESGKTCHWGHQTDFSKLCLHCKVAYMSDSDLDKVVEEGLSDIAAAATRAYFKWTMRA